MAKVVSYDHLRVDGNHPRPDMPKPMDQALSTSSHSKKDKKDNSYLYNPSSSLDANAYKPGVGY